MAENRTRLGGCDDARKAFDLEGVACCGSCHEDVEQGYYSDMSNIETTEGFYDVCCALSNARDADLKREEKHRGEAR